MKKLLPVLLLLICACTLFADDLGYSTAGMNPSFINTGSQVWFGPFAASVSGTIQVINVYDPGTNGPTVHFTVSVYSDKTSGCDSSKPHCPDALLGETPGGAKGFSGLGWQMQSLAAPLSVTMGTLYWLAYACGPGDVDNNYAYNTGAIGDSAFAQTGLTYGDGTVAPADGSGATFASNFRLGSEYATITAVGGSSPHALTVLGAGE